MLKIKSLAFAFMVAFAAGCYAPTEPTPAAEEQAVYLEDGCGANRHLEDEEQVCRRKGVWSGGVITASDAVCNGDGTLVCTYKALDTCKWSDPMKDKNSCVSGAPGCPPPGELKFKDSITLDVTLPDGDTTCDPPKSFADRRRRCIDLAPPGYDAEMKKSCLAQTDVQTQQIECCVNNAPPPPPQCLDGETLVCNLDGCICIAQNPSL